MAVFHDVVVDCTDPAALARFWAEMLDGYSVAPYDEAERARLRAKGIADPEDDPTVLVECAGVTPRLWFQRVGEPKVGKNRMHIDLRVDVTKDFDDEVSRLVALGASIEPQQPNPTLVVMRDPEGNEFCILR
jgi:Glyoxalase-like domain